MLPPERGASRKIGDVDSLTKNGFYRVAANNSQSDVKGWISQAVAVEWNYNYAVQFFNKRGRQLVHSYPSEAAALRAVESGDVREATHREPESSGNDLVLMPLLNLKEVEIDGIRMDLYETAFMVGDPETAPQASSGGTEVPGVEGR